MSAHLVFDAPIGSIIAWSDGAPRPPERFVKKLSAWKTNNSSGRLIRKQGGPNYGTVGSFVLHEADHGAVGVIAIRVHRTFSLSSDLLFTVVERPPVGAVRVLDRPGDQPELVHLAPHRAAAEQWLSEYGYPNAVLDEVSPDEIVADIIEGRAA